MRFMRTAGLCLVAMFVVSMAMTATAFSAAPAWEHCTEGTEGKLPTKYTEHQCVTAATGNNGKWQWNEIAGTEKIVAQGTLTLKDTKTLLGVSEVICSGTSEGVVGPGKLDKTTSVTVEPKQCRAVKVCEKVEAIEARDLPWQTEVFETEKKVLDLLTADGNGQPGWKVTCKTIGGVKSDECLAEEGKPESLLLENKLTKGVSGELLVLATFQHLRKAKCTEGGKESGEVLGSIANLQENGWGLRVS